MNDPILAPTFLFRFASPCRRLEPVWSSAGIALDESYRLPSFGELEGQRAFADVRAAWSDAGLSFTVRVAGKKQPPWCRSTRIDESDGLQVFIDTRDTHNVHRAGRFCHRYVFLPAGDGPRMDQPCVRKLLIPRAREQSAPPGPFSVAVRSEKRVDGYLLEAHVPAKALVGFDPAEHPRLGFTYAVIDRELGWQTYGVGPPFPIFEDPSLWGSLELLADA